MIHAVLGIDPSSRRLVGVTTYDDTNLLEGLSFYETRLPMEKIDSCYAAFVWATQVSQAERDAGNDLLVVLEEPVLGRGGPHSTIAQSKINGAVLAGLGVSAVSRITVSNSKWKKSVVGSGNASKDQITEWVCDNHPDFYNAHLSPSGKPDQDAMDAFCISLYGRQVVRFRERFRKGQRTSNLRVKKTA